jgi:hypothetical protein
MGMVTITPMGAGMATITVTATDTEGLTDTETFTVTVTPAALGAPMNVMATDDTASPGNLVIGVTWTPGENAVGHMVLVFTEDFSSVPYLDANPDAGSSTIEDVADGSYVVVVVSYVSETEYEYDHAMISVGQ